MNPENPVGDTIEALDGLIKGLRTRLDTDPPKPTIADYLRLVTMRLDLGKTHDLDRRPLDVRWVDDETLPEPDPDPNVPWPGDGGPSDEPLA